MAEDNVFIVCDSYDAWNEQFQKGKDSEKLVVVDFTAIWCGPCRHMEPHLKKLAKNTSNVIFLKVDMDNLPDVASEWNIRAVPTYLFFKDGKVIDEVIGAKPSELDSKVAHHAANSSV